MNTIFGNVYVRLAVYVASLVPGLAASWGLGWFLVDFNDGFALLVVTGDDAANGRVDRGGHSMGS